MNVGKAIYAILAADGDVSGLVTTRIYPVVAPQDATMPYIRYAVISRIGSDTKDAISPMDVFRVQVDCYDTTYGGSVDLAVHVKDALDNYSGTAATLEIERIRAESSRDDIDEDDDTYRASADYKVRLKM